MKNIYDLVIIGGGPAGVTAGIYAARLNLKTLLISEKIGGQIYNKAVLIENWPGQKSIQGPELALNLENHVKSLKIEIKNGRVSGLKKEKGIFEADAAGGPNYYAKSVIIATGCRPRKLNVPGEKEYLGKGVSACSVCDGPMFKDKQVAVIGGGNAGFETAIFLINIAKKIYILENSGSPKAFKEVQDIAASSKKIEIITNAKVEEIKGEKFVNAVVYLQGRERKTLSVDGVFPEIGYEPAASFAGNLVQFNQKGEIKVSPENCQTKTAGLFAAGDVNSGLYKQIIISAGDGAKAALAAFNYLQGENIKV